MGSCQLLPFYRQILTQTVYLPCPALMPFIILLLVPHRTSFPRFPLGHQRHWSLPHSSSDTATLSTAARSCCSRARYQIRVGYARVHELRKLNGKRLMPWLSVRTKDASLCSAVIQPLVLVPLTSLGRRAVAMEASGAQARSSAIGAADRRRAAGGRAGRGCVRRA